YLVKPFALPELLARVRVFGRRGKPDDALRLTAADLSVDLAMRKVSRAGRPIDVTPQEFRILVCLLRAKGQVVTRAMLCREVWGETHEILNNSIDVYMSYVRHKIDEGFGSRLIRTVRGVGFQLRT
ncbi:MAG: response regulator transcription factor, partial [Planctomycetes bacterium]|nr:response regulator transcription factor [Planctomycetota bacterium]